MLTLVRAALLVALTCFSIPFAEARPAAYGGETDWAASFYGRPVGHSATRERSERRSASNESRSSSARSSSSEGRSSGVGPRPAAWCGWYMRTRHGGGPEFNLAANWRKYGSPAEPQVGAIVVWPHHVGEIVGRASNGQWIVLSGNDSGRVQSRARSISGATVRI